MNLRHLFYFWKVAGAGSVTRASEELHLTPQTVSGQVQLLERHLGKELFVRRGRRLELTEDGKFVLGYANELFALHAELEKAARDFTYLGRKGKVGAFRLVAKDVGAFIDTFTFTLGGLPSTASFTIDELSLASFTNIDWDDTEAATLSGGGLAAWQRRSCLVKPVSTRLFPSATSWSPPVPLC